MPRPGDDHFGIGILDLKQGRAFPFKGLRAGNIVADLNVDLVLVIVFYNASAFENLNNSDI